MDENNVHEAEIVEEEVKGGLGASLIDIFLDPSKVFKRIDAGERLIRIAVSFTEVAVAGVAQIDELVDSGSFFRSADSIQ